jgi:endonuclease/exonuclease/phosphatase family metal-dependent hydrolase
MKRWKFLNKPLFYINAVLAVATLSAYVSPYVSPLTFWPVAFTGLALPFLLLANCIFLIYWVVKGNSKLFLPLIVIILGYKSIPNFIQVRFQNESDKENTIKVLSFNVRVFDLYMWTEEKLTRNKILDFLDREDPDILCIQEFYYQEEGSRDYEFKTLDTLTKLLSAKNYHVYYTSTLRGKDHWGIVTFSKFPIVKKGLVPFAIKDDNVCIYTDLRVNDDTLRVYNSHLASIKLDKHDYKAMQKINQNEYSSGFGKEKLLLKKLKYGFQRRASQADSIKKSIAQSPYPTIVCGDFNDTPASYAYQSIRGDLNDAFVAKGSGLGRTYIGEFPSFRIDYILYNDSLTAESYVTHKEKLSDHHPISALFTLR